MKITGKAQQLADVMVQLSVKYYATEWMMGLEFELWNEVLGNQDLLTASEATKLKDLSVTCDGWVSMKYPDENLEFISLSGWKKIFREKNPF